MKKKVEKIVEQIKELVDQLAEMSGGQAPAQKPSKRAKSPSIKKGASGALSQLTEEGFFDSPKELSVIMIKLQEIGHYYPRPSVSMNLLNLTKRRTFSRIKDPKTKHWQYVLRR